MVLDDSNSQDLKEKIPLINRYASPVDRLLAKFFDFVFLSPVLALVIEFNEYLFFRNKFLLQDTRFLSLINFQIIIFVVFLYHILCIYRFQATIGQQILKLKIIKADRSSLKFYDVWIRQTSWFLNFVFLGFPLLEILSHKKRQSLHDRLSETILATETTNYSSSHFLEIDLVKTTYKLGTAFLFILTLAVNFYLYETLTQHEPNLKSDTKCFDFQDESKTFLDLDKHLSAYYIGLGSKDCVYQSLNQELIKKNLDQELIKLAQYFLHSDDKKIKNQYRKDICNSQCEWLDQAGDLVEKKLPLFSKIYKYKNSKYENLDQRIAGISNLRLPVEFNGQLFEDLIGKDKNLKLGRSPASEEK